MLYVRPRLDGVLSSVAVHYTCNPQFFIVVSGSAYVSNMYNCTIHFCLWRIFVTVPFKKKSKNQPPITYHW